MHQKSLVSLDSLILTAMFWAGWTDRDNEGYFTNVNTGKVLEKKSSLYDIWWPGEPNGGVLENCAVSWPTRGQWFDYMCFETAKGFCNILCFRAQAFSLFWMVSMTVMLMKIGAGSVCDKLEDSQSHLVQSSVHWHLLAPDSNGSC